MTNYMRELVMYPILGISAADAVALRIKKAMDEGVNQDSYCDRGFEDLETKFVHYKEHDGIEVSIDDLFVKAQEIYLTANYESRSVYELEENHAQYIHEYLSQLPSQVLQDPSFWRFLALFPFRRYLTVRESDLAPKRYGGGSGVAKAYWLLPRSFIWGRKCFDPSTGSYDLVHEMLRQRELNGYSSGFVIDFYHSHIVRAAWSADSQIALDFLRSVFSNPVLFDEDTNASRPTNVLSSAIARLSNNVLLEVADDALAKEIQKAKMHLLAEGESGESASPEE